MTILNEFQLKMCDIQGRLFELSGAKGYDSVPFIKAFMTSEVAKGLDSKFNRMQWAGEEYLLAELADSAELAIGGSVYYKEVLAKICVALECTMDDIIEFVPSKNEDQ